MNKHHRKNKNKIIIKPFNKSFKIMQNSVHNKLRILEVRDMCGDHYRWVADIELLLEICKEGVLIKEHTRLHIVFNITGTFKQALNEIPVENLVEFSYVPTFLKNNDSFIIFHKEKKKYIITKTKHPSLFDEFAELKRLSTIIYVPMGSIYENRSKIHKPVIHQTHRKISLRKYKESSQKRAKIRKVKAIPAKPQRYILRTAPYSGEMSERPHFPIQVSEDQRESQSEQVVSDHETLFRPDISYNFSQSHYQSHEEDTPRYSATLQTPNSFQRPSPPPRYPDYVNERQRLDSFEHWPISSPTQNQLADAGFFFTNQADLVRCFQCGIGLKDFSAADDPLVEHVRHSGDCPYLLVHLGEDRLADIKSHLQTTDPDYNRQLQWNNRHNAGVTSRYRHPEYQTYEARLATFRRWPSNIGQTPSQLAEAGLYYTGFEDHVRCFACDGGLRRWDPEDDPWTEHCRWFPACPYCIEQKGEEYIALVQASIEQDHLGASGGGPMINAAEQLKIKEKEAQAFYNTTKALFDDMGFQEADVKEAVLELCNRGTPTPEIEDVVDLIGVIHERKEAEKEKRGNQSESLLEQNTRLKSMIYCSSCRKNTVSALFLPCTHLELCMECAEPLIVCPVCNRVIREKIRTFMG